MPLLASPWARQLLRRLLSVEVAESHSARFTHLISQARLSVSEVPPLSAAQAVEKGAVLIDIRERGEYQRSHAVGAINIPRGVLELDIDKFLKHDDQTIFCLCSEGSRSILAAETLLRMGFPSVHSIQGGYRGWVEAGLPARTNRPLVED